MGDDLLKGTAATGIAMVLYRALAEAELAAPTAAQGAFIPAGSSFDAIAALSKVLETATNDVLIVDPYMDDKTLSDFVPLVREQISVRLLADQQAHKPSLKPAVARWQQQYQQARPLVAKVATARTLHDRVILIDSQEAWSLTQSLNAFATRSPATIVRVDPDTAALKIVAYEAMWASATAI